MADIASEVQNNLTDLKHLYLTKRTYLLDRLISQQHKVESFFKLFYETLDSERKKVLAKEYSLRNQMDYFENDLTKLLNKMKNYTYTEFFHEQYNINSMISSIKSQLNNFSCYVPDFTIKMEDVNEVKQKISDDIKLKL